MGKIISIINHKGGVGKTTTAVDLGAALCRKGKKVLLVDLDSQANLTLSVGLEEDIEKTIYGALKDEYPLPIVNVPPFDVVPSCLDLSAAETELINKIGRERILSKVLQPVKANYDYILIDCPPSLALLSINAMAASDSVLIPVQAQYLAMRGMEKLVNVIEQVKEAINPKLTIEGILITMYKGRQNLSKSISEIVRENYHGKVFKNFIRESTALAEAAAAGTSVFELKKSNGQEDYDNLCNEILENNE